MLSAQISRTSLSVCLGSWAYLQHLNLTLGVKLKVTISLEPALDQLPELGWESRVIEMVNSESGPGCLGRVSGSDTLLGGTD